MTKQEFIYLTKNIIAPIDKTSRFHPEQIAAVFDVLYAQRLSSVPEITIGELELYSKTYTSQTVTLDATTGRYYTDLTIAIVPIPRVSSGIVAISTNQGADLDFVPTTELEVYYYDGSVTQTNDVTVGYWLKGTRIWYDDAMTSSIASAGVKIIALPRFRSFADSDTIYFPGCTDYDAVQAVINMLMQTSPVDLRANNA